MTRLEQLQQLLDATPDEPFILFAIAKEYEKGQNLDQALTWYLRLREANPDYVGLYYHLGKLYEEKQELEKALEAYQAGMEVAKTQGDQHALGELAGAKLGIED